MWKSRKTILDTLNSPDQTKNRPFVSKRSCLGGKWGSVLSEHPQVFLCTIYSGHFSRLLIQCFLFPHKWISASSWRHRGLTLQCRQDELIYMILGSNLCTTRVLNISSTLAVDLFWEQGHGHCRTDWMSPRSIFFSHTDTHFWRLRMSQRTCVFFFECVFESWQKDQMQTKSCFLNIRCPQCSGSLKRLRQCVWLQQRVCKCRMMLHCV